MNLDCLGALVLIDINWLHFLILIFAAFSINYLIINEVNVYFSGKSYLSKWVLCFMFSIAVVLLKNYVPSSFTYLLALAVAGGVEFISTLVVLMKKRKDYSQVKEEYRRAPHITNEMFEYSQSQIAALKNRENEISANLQNSNQASAANSIDGKADRIDGEFPSKANTVIRDTKIINSDRLYGQQEFLKESRGQKITLSPYLRSNLDNSTTPKK